MGAFVMPSLGADMTEGTLLQWLVHPGDTVHSGDVVAEVDTTKAAIEVECFESGVIGELLVPEGETVPVGTPLATIVGAQATATETPSPASEIAVPTAVPEVVSPAPMPAPVANLVHPPSRTTPLVRKLAAEAGIDLATVHGSAPGGRIVRSDVEHAVADRDTAVRQPVARVPGARLRVSGYARRLAAELGVELSTVTGSGPDGAIRAADVRAAVAHRSNGKAAPPTETTGLAEPAGDTAPAGQTTPESGPRAPAIELPPRDPVAMRRTIAAAMTKSKRTVPHYYLSSTIDMAAAMRWLRVQNLRLPITERLLPAALLLTATARAARAVPDMNGYWIDDEFRPADTVALGVVVSLRGGGIIVPTIPAADTLGPPAMMAALRGVVQRTRTLRLRSSDTAPATITVTNLGDLGVDSVFGVIPAPQVAIAGFGAVTERPCAVDGLLGVRDQVTATLAADHRASDGAVGARLLHALSDLLQHPEEL
ncbi:2-oxo acid dehydrogenase subunit E2 [Nocardia seriolae]|uniref:2-oxo acid dehydrogenase subunit E2 n=2 Tax=Nocardia seriolae TaxID=37332 RepID=UPI000D136B49|nr:2-oxo acid dehydrogenase subunit E2 [Nocardia seriolae]PSK27324.1 dehydrogenase [Nocardia seriolae]QOW35710.1 2-oxo acid dehydrogenase subunit E2 [Nocardia seriolae]QUN16799.1 2-oxo acid dehydrogenase subunit E2 [Nocardia seriolae]WNJ56101.1 2-oxo acid dehydrogenase subunit E2 [Nocardia seriolae]